VVGEERGLGMLCFAVFTLHSRLNCDCLDTMNVGIDDLEYHPN
jgi:hypothetical protein